MPFGFSNMITAPSGSRLAAFLHLLGTDLNTAEGLSHEARSIAKAFAQ